MRFGAWGFSGMCVPADELKRAKKQIQLSDTFNEATPKIRNA